MKPFSTDIDRKFGYKDDPVFTKKFYRDMLFVLLISIGFIALVTIIFYNMEKIDNFMFSVVSDFFYGPPQKKLGLRIMLGSWVLLGISTALYFHRTRWRRWVVHLCFRLRFLSKFNSSVKRKLGEWMPPFFKPKTK